MKNLKQLTWILLLTAVTMLSQAQRIPPISSFPGGNTPVNPLACNTNTSICQPGVSSNFSFGSTSPTTFYQGCLNQVQGNNEYGFIIVYVVQSGPLNLLVDGSSNSGYIDVSVFNIPSGASPCTAIQSSANMIACNYATNSSGCVQFGTSFGCSSNVPAPYVTAGSTLMIVAQDWSNASNTFTVQLNPNGAQAGPPNATPINSTPQFCLDAAPSQLTAQSNGGTWSGPGVSASGLFNPANAGLGSHTINYTIGQAPCQSSSSATVTVVDCPCSIQLGNPVPSPCVNTTNKYSVSTQISFVNPPSTGQLIVQDCAGNQIAFLPPFTSPITANIIGLTATGNPNCSITAHFTTKPCTATQAYAAPAGCNCASFPPITASFDIDNVSCYVDNDGTIDLTVTGGVNTPFTYAWSPGSITTQDLNNLTAGNYTVVITDAVGCQYDSTVTVHAPINIPTAISDKFVCSGDTVNINPLPINGVNYHWSPEQYFFGDTDAEGTFYGLNAGPGLDTIFVNVKTDSLGACGQQNLRIYLVSPPEVKLLQAGYDTTSLCPNDTLLLVNSSNISSSPTSTYLWNTGQSTPSINVTTPNTYWLQITNNAGCKFRDSLEVVPVIPPAAYIDPVKYICGNEYVNIFATSYADTDHLLWSTGETADTISVNTAGTYTLFISNDCGTDTVFTEVIQIPSVPPTLLPNIFTPNGDGVNDVYEVDDAFYYSKTFNVRIFNRWGSKIYDTDDKTINWKPKNISDGVYFMSIVYTSCDGKEQKVSQTVTVISK